MQATHQGWPATSSGTAKGLPAVGLTLGPVCRIVIFGFGTLSQNRLP